MESIKKRNTKQKATLLEYLKSNSNKHLTAEQISRDLSSLNVSQATVYRLLNSLAKDGKIRKYHIEEKQPMCFQYIEDSCIAPSHYHFICNTCEKVFHFEDKEVEKLKDSLAKSQDFFIDTDKTVFYGTCKKCMQGGKK
ncbi:MAG: transcriptional repressor [Clostridia bacterium]|nr:transcriptional repressor [Clostridia bacterium]